MFRAAANAGFSSSAVAARSFADAAAGAAAVTSVSFVYARKKQINEVNHAAGPRRLPIFRRIFGVPARAVVLLDWLSRGGCGHFCFAEKENL